MAGQKILLPYNFTPWDQKALDFVIRTFIPPPETQITIFHAYTPVPEIETEGSTVMDKMKGNLSYLSKMVSDQEESLKTAKEYLVKNGFLSDQIDYIFKPRDKDVASEIIDLVTTDRFDLIVMNHKPGKITRFFTGSIFNKVVSSLKDMTLCLVT